MMNYVVKESLVVVCPSHGCELNLSQDIGHFLATIHLENLAKDPIIRKTL